FLLDTDHITILQRQTQPECGRILLRMAPYPATDFFFPIVSLHEQFLGWNSYINQARTTTDVVRGYAQFQIGHDNYCAVQVASFDQAAASEFDRLSRQGVRVGAMDLRIASIALSRRMTVLTRNLRDFRRVPGLTVEDWTV